MKVYLAGAAKELEVCESWRDLLIGEGIEISYDWMRDIRAAGENVRDRDLSQESRHQYARNDLNGVTFADVFWLLVPEEKGVGCWVELGYALRQYWLFRNLTVIASGDHLRTIFLSGEDTPAGRAGALCFDSHAEAFDEVVRLSRQARSLA